MDTAERLWAMEEVRRVKTRYFRCVDTKDFDGLRRVFAPDAVFDRRYGRSVRDPFTGDWDPPLPPEPQLVHGVDEIIAMVRRAVDGTATVHHGHQAEIDVETTDSASAVWSMSDELRDRQGRLILAGRGHYEERYRKTAEGWRIAFSRITRLALVKGDGERS